MSPLKSIQDPAVVDVISRKHNDSKFHKSPEAWEDQLFYFLLPDRFSDGKESDDKGNSGTTPVFRDSDRDTAICDEETQAKWMDAGTKFVGGTIRGATSKLGYLKRLGVTAIWFGPILKQIRRMETYHGYAIQDYLDVDDRFGTREDLKKFVAAAHREGIYILLDIILNHSGDVFKYDSKDMPMFNGTVFPVRGYWSESRDPEDLLPFSTVDESLAPHAYPHGAIWPKELQAKENFKRKGCLVHWKSAPEVVEADFYDLKSLNLGKPSIENFTPGPALITLCEVYKFWIAFADIDGYRIDTVTYMGEGPTQYFAGAMHDYARDLGKDNFFLVGEISGSDVLNVVKRTGLDAALAIGDIQSDLWHLPRGQVNPAKYFGQFRSSANKTCRSVEQSDGWERNQIMTMIDDHDQAWKPHAKGRFCSEPGSQPFLHSALGINLCASGIPCIYYGTEQAFDGGSEQFIGQKDFSADRFIREAMHGGAFGAFRSRNRHVFNESTETYRQVQDLARLRRSETALRRGEQILRETSKDGRHFSIPVLDNSTKRLDGVFAWSRIYKEIEVLCVINTHATDSVAAWIGVDRDPGTMMSCLYPPGRDYRMSAESIAEGSKVAVHGVFPPRSFTAYK